MVYDFLDNKKPASAKHGRVGFGVKKLNANARKDLTCADVATEFFD
jgi:hypothetical protein